MYNQFDEIEKIKADIPEIKELHKCSGIGELEETLNEDPNVKNLVCAVEDEGDGFLSLSDSHLDNGYFTLYILGKVKANRSDSRKQVKAECKAAGVKLFKRMRQSGKELGDPFYGIDFERVDYNQLGPVGDDMHGFSFSYVMKDQGLE